MKLETSSKLLLICFLFLGFGIYFLMIGNNIENYKYNLAVFRHEESENAKKQKGEPVFSHSFNYNRKLNWAEYLTILFFVISMAAFLVVFRSAHQNTQQTEEDIKIKLNQ